MVFMVAGLLSRVVVFTPSYIFPRGLMSRQASLSRNEVAGL
jgi:hypothetical protein